jgi:hypothetical protein
MALMLSSVPLVAAGFGKKRTGNPNPRASRTFDRMDFLFF